MAKKILATMVIGLLVLSGAFAHAGVPPASTCKDKKGKATGTKALGLLKAFGKNLKTPNVGKLASDVSKAQSKFTKGFTKAEFSGSGASKDCQSIEDADDIEAKVDAFVADVLGDLSPPPSTTTTTTTSSTTTTSNGCPILEFATGPLGGSCGRINDDVAGTGTDLTPYGGSGPQLDCGTLYIGGGDSAQPPSATPDGASSRYGISDCSNPNSMVLAPLTSTQTGNNRNCTAPGCFFGPPLPIPNAGSPGASTCIINTIAASPAVGGGLDAPAGSATITLPLTVTARVTGDLEPMISGLQPCPRCVSGICTSGPNSGGGCTSPTSLLSSHDCPPPGTSLAPFLVDLSPLSASPYLLTAPGGAFCPMQTTAGCFGTGAGICKYIETIGSPAGDLTGGGALAQTLSSIYCIPKTGSALINGVANLPGPGAVTLKGSAELLP
jgi:hypothetical protein